MFRKHLTNHFLYSSSLPAKITSKLFKVSPLFVEKKKKLNGPVRAKNSVRQTQCLLITCPLFRKFFMRV